MQALNPHVVQQLSDLIRDIPDFPKKGILFKDISPLLANNRALALTTDSLAAPFTHLHIDHVVALESRGFLFGTNLAEKLGAGFVPVRKPGKLPAKTISQNYELEYGVDSLEIHSDAIKKGESVLIHDDVIATGGSALAAKQLVERLGAQVIGYSFIIELEFLKGREKLASNYFHSIIKY